MRTLVARAAEAVRRGISSTDVEEACRFAVARAMEDGDRLLHDEEVADIVEPTVHDETAVDVESAIDGDGEVVLTEREWDSLGDGERALDAEGARCVVTSGRVRRVRMVGDGEAARVATAISADMRAAVVRAGIEDGCDYPFDEFCAEGANACAECPECGSANVSPVWYGDCEIIYHCHDCDGEFEAPMDPDTATAEELTLEEHPLSDGNSAFTWYDEDGWHLEIDEPDGTLVRILDVSSPDEAESLMDGYESGEFDVEPGEVLKSVENGNELVVSAIDGRFAEINGKKASLSNLKVSKMLGRFISDKSAVRELIARSGDAYVNDCGDRLIIESAENGVIVYNEVSINKLSGLTQDITARCNKSEFIDVLENGGYAYKVG